MRRFTLALTLASLTATTALAFDGTLRSTAVRSDARELVREIYDGEHWLLQQRLDARYREPIVNPLAGPPRTRYGRGGIVYDRPAAGPFGQIGTLRVAGTIMPRGPGPQILRADGRMVSIAEERAERRLEKFAREDIEIRFHSPHEAYDARYPNVVYLDSE